MSKFGDYPGNAEWGPKEDWRLIVPNQDMPPSSVWNWSIGTYTMPFPGRLICDMKTRCGWTSDQTYMRCYIASATPTADKYSRHVRWSGYGPGGYWWESEVPLWAQWDFLAAGTVVNIIVSVESGPWGNVRHVASGGFVRAIPSLLEGVVTP